MNLPISNDVSSSSLLNPGDVARLLNISRSMVYKLINSREITTIRIGKSVRIKENDLQDYLTRHTVHEYTDDEIPLRMYF
jgi:excisionase family DNA binding protein